MKRKSGDKLAGVAANSAEERVAAKVVLPELTLNDLFNHPVVDYDEDEVTRIIIDQVNMRIFESIKHWTVAELKGSLSCLQKRLISISNVFLAA